MSEEPRDLPAPEGPPNSLTTADLGGLPLVEYGAPVEQRLGKLAGRSKAIERELERALRHSLKKPVTAQERERAELEEDGLIVAHTVLHQATISRLLEFQRIDLATHQEVFDVDRVRSYLAEVGRLVDRKLQALDGDAAAELRAELKALNRQFGIGT